MSDEAAPPHPFSASADAAALQREDPEFSVWVIYDRPSDHPSGPIARAWRIERGEMVATRTTLTGSLSELRDRFQSAGLLCFDRAPEDDLVIVESWL